MSMSATNTPWVFAVANGSQTQFSFPYLFFLNTDLEVFLGGVLTTAYTVSGAGVLTGGTITFYAPPGANTVVFIRRVTARQQLLDYQAGDAFTAESHEAALDRLVAMVQDLLEEGSRRPALATATAQALRHLLWPAPVSQRLLGWNADGTALTLYDATIRQVTVDPVTGETHGKTNATLTAAGGETSLIAAALLPAGAKIKQVGYRCLVSFNAAGGLTSVDLGGMGVTSGWGQQLGITAGAVNTYGQCRADTPHAVSAEDVTLLPNGAAVFSAGGQAKLTAFWKTFTPDT